MGFFIGLGTFFFLSINSLLRPEPCGSGGHGWRRPTAKRDSLDSEYEGGVEQVALRARVHHEAKNWLILTDCSNAFNTVKRTAMLAEAATCVPALTPFVAKCYGEMSAPEFFQMESGERRKIDCSSGVQQGDAMGPALFCMPLLPVLKRTRAEFEPRGVEAFAYLDDIIIGMIEITPDTVEVVPFLQRELPNIGIAINPSKTVTLPPKGHVPTPEQIALLEGISVSIAERGGVKVVGVPIGTDEYVRESAMEVVRNGRAEQLARLLSRMPDKQSANLIVTGSMVQRISYLERVMGPELSLAECKKADDSALWMLEKIFDLPGAAEESSLFADGCPTNMLTLQPHQQAQASLSTGAGGFGLSSAEARRISASVGSLVATVPEVLADLSGALENKVRRELPDSDLVWRTWNSVRDLRDVHWVSEEAMANIVPESWRDRAFRAGEQSASGQSIADVLPAHDAETISSSKAQHRLGKLVNRVHYERYVSSLDQLPETRPQRDTSGSQGEKETRDLTRARQRSQSGSGATAFLRATPVDSARTIPASEFVTVGKRFLGIKEFLAARCRCCGEAEVDTRRARLCHRAGAQVNKHQPLVHALSRTLKSMSIRHQVESRAPFHADRDLRMDIVIEAGGLRDATAPEYSDKAILLDVAYADPQAGVHMRAGSADRNGSAASISEARKRNHCARPGQVSFDEHNYKLATLEVESFGRLGKEGSDLLDQVAASIVGRTDASSLARKGVCKERLFQITFVTTQVAISRRAHRYRLFLRDRPAARGREEQSGGLRPLAWGGNVAED